jgi:hypothetical protein
MISQTNHLKLPRLSFLSALCGLSARSPNDYGMKKRNEPKILSLKPLIPMWQEKQNKAKFQFLCSLGLRFLEPWVPGFLCSWHFEQTNPFKKSILL